ncbi:hypothetical protein [Methanofollis formosanus]|nr:hypothetical protein [Methanofollis formosanus]
MLFDVPLIILFLLLYPALLYTGIERIPHPSLRSIAPPALAGLLALVMPFLIPFEAMGPQTPAATFVILTVQVLATMTPFVLIPLRTRGTWKWIYICCIPFFSQIIAMLIGFASGEVFPDYDAIERTLGMIGPLYFTMEMLESFLRMLLISTALCIPLFLIDLGKGGEEIGEGE